MARYHGLAALKDDAISLASSSVGIVAGAAAAKWVTSKTDKALSKADAPTEPMFPGAYQLSALVPAVFGTLIKVYGSPRTPQGALRDAVDGVAAGMFAYSIGKLVVSFIEKPAESDFAKALPFNGLAGDGVYDYSLGNAEFGPGGVDAYMMNGFGDAPTTTEVLNGAPVDVVPFNGLGSAPVSVSTYAPLNTALTA